MSKGDLDRAIADYGQTISLDPKYAAAYVNRGVGHLYSGSLPKALADLNQAIELDPKDANGHLWLEIVNKRSHLASRLPSAIAQLDMTKWPAPVIRLFLNQITPEAVLAAAEDTNTIEKAERVCLANFFIGELALSKGSKEDAARRFRLVADGCSMWLLSAAKFEQKALGISK